MRVCVCADFFETPHVDVQKLDVCGWHLRKVGIHCESTPKQRRMKGRPAFGLYTRTRG